jgi:hypothetical protein
MRIAALRGAIPLGQTPAAPVPTLTLFVHMHKGCTRDAQGMRTGPSRQMCRAARREARRGCRPVLGVRGPDGVTRPADRVWRQCRDMPMSGGRISTLPSGSSLSAPAKGGGRVGERATNTTADEGSSGFPAWWPPLPSRFLHRRIGGSSRRLAAVSRYA